MSDRVHVLLATYNGVEYLGEQLRSIESQSLPVARVTIRDDGSSDGTQSFSQEWAKGKSYVRFLQGTRLGVTNNFFTLLKDSEEGCNYFAFCDQDDVWLPDKIERAVTVLRKYSAEEPVLYCSRVEYVNEKLGHMGYSRIPNRISFANALVENIATGCTVVLNGAARELICKNLPVRSALLHDWWSYLTVSALGMVVYDEAASIKYRQHARNQEGGTSSSRELFKRRMVRFLQRAGDKQLLSDQAVEFKRCFGELLSTRDRGILGRFLSIRCGLWSRASYTAAMEVRRQTWIDTAVLRAMILLGRV
jgi:glycosyltransferase involved in cell wall biosynthesis